MQRITLLSILLVFLGIAILCVEYTIAKNIAAFTVIVFALALAWETSDG